MGLKADYNKIVKPALQQELQLTNSLATPKLIKIVVNVGLGEALTDHRVLERVGEQLMVITGQKPLITRAKTSIAAFKLRAGDKIGLKVTLRGRRMYDFFEKLVKLVLPRVRDFRGVSRSGFDGQGNYNLGIAEQIVFPEIEYAKVDKVRGIQITIVTTATTPEAGLKLLEKMGMPFTK
ncbi:MAG: 50S ribosomal protein L5 [Candidatus Gottesmanbacteria bacterium GW2011_GWB1_43_11]|uniref:Large ribosomal subunit protein uL5 n=1 Tax=Candidatus Gottesmanbacteria bacterium GW2011_GWB1_43_11 TaxID=1618446 RepID=A0A0G1CMZ7_9BACT|nr:MAG: 50S ribosomal protein L5 [Candidatus Gottesmanbacteria bacterium GW2011_GWA2_42_16]KKS55747.1 MAG: 50S ribosomal protein L5 [Candidatus Gottesmanbacteria bacterium GW2011_GWA1_42_26]KKS81947.1 MAG: ribosomal protein L5, large subunit ribosomal protein L5 [Candidatus Gottesmanbacteria bacterium GW2011_GWC1_43_10]KKS86867.1 MAG: 50S ribosomal protein L5 [Candidatus Gottesmanbacteria bacterium GW2011_GWB1_43_11]OGG10481.1 MAG: 50S ribosomal protein L5 [Candidatus Gottesmanbacteria bacteriu